jgi:hypothetical protein
MYSKTLQITLLCLVASAFTAVEVNKPALDMLELGLEEYHAKLKSQTKLNVDEDEFE